MHSTEINVASLPIDQGRKRRFLENYRQDRAKTDTIRRLFKQAGAFLYEPEFSPGHRFGFNALIRKAPFCDIPNWAEYRTWEFAVAAERYLLKKFGSHVGAPERADLGPVTPDRLPTLLAAVESKSAKAGYQASLCVLMGAIPPEDIVEIHESGTVAPTWANHTQMSTPWILGQRKGLPVLHLPEADVQGVCGIDLARLGTFIQYDDVQFDLTEIGIAEALRIQEQRTEYRHTDSPEANQSVAELRQQVHLILTESSDIVLKDPGAVFFP